MIFAEYEKRVETVLVRLVPTCETLLFTGGGDRGIYPAGKALVQASNCEKLVLLRIDPHMDERSIFCRSDPQIRREVIYYRVNRFRVKIVSLRGRIIVLLVLITCRSTWQLVCTNLTYLRLVLWEKTIDIIYCKKCVNLVHLFEKRQVLPSFWQRVSRRMFLFCLTRPFGPL